MPPSDIGEMGYRGMRESKEFFENWRSTVVWTVKTTESILRRVKSAGWDWPSSAPGKNVVETETIVGLSMGYGEKISEACNETDRGEVSAVAKIRGNGLKRTGGVRNCCCGSVSTSSGARNC